MNALIAALPPPSRQTWETSVFLFQFFPLVTIIQHATDFYPQGKTSIPSRFNLPGKTGWFLMEIPGMLTAAYCMLSIPNATGVPATSLPPGNWTMLVLYLAHYSYRAVLAPLVLNPSMSPIHPLVALSAASFQVVNGLGIGGYVAGYGPTTTFDWAGRAGECLVGLVIWGWALLGNMIHDDELREIRREAMRRAQKAADEKSESLGKKVAPEGVDKMYAIPVNLLFKLVLYPHYLCEWIEWLGFYVLAGRYCVPARSFLINEITTMLPRSLAGWRWYARTFGVEKLEGRKAVIPFLL